MARDPGRKEPSPDDDAHPFGARDDAATLLTPEEKHGLIPSWVTFRHELNEVEQANIAAGAAWAFRALRRRELLDERTLTSLHKRMLGEVWTWAGRYRSSERNIGIAAWQIPVEVRTLLDDARAWVEHRSFERDELAVRFHHRLVAIHPFPNGNGRHARLMADLLVVKLGGERFSWGSLGATASLADGGGAMRGAYVDALRRADRHDLGALVAFARS